MLLILCRVNGEQHQAYNGPTNRHHLATIGLHYENAFDWVIVPRHHLGNEMGHTSLTAALGHGNRLSGISHILSIELRLPLSPVMTMAPPSMFPLALQVTTSPMAAVIKSHQHLIQFKPNTRQLESGHTKNITFM